MRVVGNYSQNFHEVFDYYNSFELFDLGMNLRIIGRVNGSHDTIYWQVERVFQTTSQTLDAF